MELRDRPSVLRRGAAPPDERTCFRFLALACAVHIASLSLFWIKIVPPTEFAIAGATGPLTRARLVRVTSLPSIPAPEAAAREASRARPKPALMKRYQPGARIVPRQERGPAKKSPKDDAKAPPREAASAPTADLAPRWYSADSTRAADVRTDGDFRFAYYLAALRNKIGSRWAPPQSLDARGQTVRAVIYFRISRDGQVTLAQVENSSGFTFFDQTALRALLSATPLPPLPAGYTDNYLGVHFGFEFVQ